MVRVGLRLYKYSMTYRWKHSVTNGMSGKQVYVLDYCKLKFVVSSMYACSQVRSMMRMDARVYVCVRGEGRERKIGRPYFAVVHGHS